MRVVREPGITQGRGTEGCLNGTGSHDPEAPSPRFLRPDVGERGQSRLGAHAGGATLPGFVLTDEPSKFRLRPPAAVRSTRTFGARAPPPSRRLRKHGARVLCGISSTDLGVTRRANTLTLPETALHSTSTRREEPSCTVRLHRASFPAPSRGRIDDRSFRHRPARAHRRRRRRRFFLPALVAHWRKIPNTDVIFLLNLLFGWTGIPWLILLVWAFVAHPKTSR